MSKPFDFGGVNLNAGGDSSGARPLAETPFCMAILGDFSGRANRKLCEPQSIGKRRAVLVDRDNFDEVLASYKPEIKLPLGDGGSLHLRFSDIDEFHPDSIFARLDAFAKLRALRQRLQDPSSFKDAADELGIGRKEPAAAPAPQHAEPVASRPPSAVSVASGSLLDDMIERTESLGPQDRPRREPDAVRAFAQRVAAQSLISTPDPRQPEILSVMDRAISALMRAVLHNPDFQALEGIWRAIFLLVRQLETSSQLKLFLVDISKDELAADLNSAAELRGTGVYRLLVEKTVETPGADPWALIVGDFSFGPQKDDAVLLSRMARIANRAGAAFLAQANPQVLGCSSLASAPHPRDWAQTQEQGWSEFRHLPEAVSVGLALPRVLMRLPYGRKTSALESFDFEEMSDPVTHEDYLWGNGALALALLLGQSFNQSGWEMRLGEAAGMNGLPLHIYSKNGESYTQPCAEVPLTEEAVEGMLDAGLIPLVSFKNRDSVRVARYQSVANPQRPLAGPWV